MDNKQLKKATITVLGGESQQGKVISVLFNPNGYSFDRSNAYKSTPVPGLASPLIHFVNGEADQLSMELFLDDYTDPEGPTSREQKEQRSVPQRLRELNGLLNIDRDLHAPPPVRFNWGPMEFVAVLEKLGHKVTMFHPDGTPARATLSVTFKEYRTLKQQLERPRRESSDKSKRRVMMGRDSLWALAAREYGDPAEWPRITEANDLDDPRDITPGDWLVLPPMEEPDGSGRARR
jgi:nucleoid-associated protein YgaU